MITRRGCIRFGSVIAPRQYGLDPLEPLLTLTLAQLSFHFCKDQTLVSVFRLRLTLLRQGADEGRHGGLLLLGWPRFNPVDAD